MSLWGTKDSVPSAGTITINLSTEQITGNSTQFVTGAYTVTPGDIINVGAGATYGRAVISSVTSNTIASVATTQFLIPDPGTGLIPAGTAYSIDQKPKYTLEDGQYFAPDAKANRYSRVFGVDVAEQQAADVAPDDARKYAAPHAGWVGVTTYIDCDGNLRVKTETLVAGSSITNDIEDTVYPDYTIVIAGVTASPSASVGVGTTVTLTVSASSTPSGASLTYQWQKSTAPNGSTYNDISGATGISTDIANPTNGNNNYNYRVVVSATGANSVTSSATKLVVTP